MNPLKSSIAGLVLGWALASGAQAGTLSPEAEAAVLDALMDEYHAAAFYTALVAEYGATTAFTNILAAEQKHSDALIRLLTKYDIAVPANPWLDGTRALEALPASLTAAYDAGVIAEINNMALYQDELLPAVAAYPDITKVFTNLMLASQTRHLPTFEACAAGACGNTGASAAADLLAGLAAPVQERERARSQQGAGAGAKRDGGGKGGKDQKREGKGGKG